MKAFVNGKIKLANSQFAAVKSVHMIPWISRSLGCSMALARRYMHRPCSRASILTKSIKLDSPRRCQARPGEWPWGSQDPRMFMSIGFCTASSNGSTPERRRGHHVITRGPTRAHAPAQLISDPIDSKKLWGKDACRDPCVSYAHSQDTLDVSVGERPRSSGCTSYIVPQTRIRDEHALHCQPRLAHLRVLLRAQ